ncbi:transcription factor A, mitochondrial [Plectropomus leopardus]|uniref:transcription factor A, mitochondrial n=1 Tax=Plectropomus leopardus TaxID=160734 RepID=UPI001C4C3C02|nr:transcription factor A, mitochondrial [Plectropomus leopardus]
MAPFSLMTASVSWLAKSFSVLSRTSTLARCTSVLSAAYVNPVKCLTSQASPPKRPPNGYLRYVMQQKPIITRHQPEIKSVDVIRMLGQQWRALTPEQKRPFQEAYQQAREQFKVDFERYQAQLTPVQVRQQALEKSQRLAKRKASRKKRELKTLGKPKRSRTAFNIFMSEHFLEAKGSNSQEKMKSLLQEWRNMLGHQKQVYRQLAEDDRIRYKNEMKSWEEHMIEIGRDDVIQERALPPKDKAPPKKGIKKLNAKAKAVKNTTGKGKVKTIEKMTHSSSTKTARTTKKT